MPYWQRNRSGGTRIYLPGSSNEASFAKIRVIRHILTHLVADFQLPGRWPDDHPHLGTREFWRCRTTHRTGPYGTVLGEWRRAILRDRSGCLAGGTDRIDGWLGDRSA